MKRKLYFVGDAPILKISALTGKGVHKLRPVLQEAIQQYHRRVPTRYVNRAIADAQQRQPAGHGVRVLHALQGATDPPTFTLFVNRELPHTYLRYLERSIREAFEFGSHATEAARQEAHRLAVPWCEDCAKYWTPAAMNEDGTCPTCGRLVETPTTAEPITAKDLDLRKLAAGEDGEEAAKTPWHFKLLMVLLALYLTWRLVQLFT